MSDWKHRISDGFHWKVLLQYFFQGLVILAPVCITIYAVWWLFDAVDSILPNIMHSLFPRWWGIDEDGAIRRIPGLGFLIVICLVLFVGRVSSSFVMSKLVDLLDGLLERTPGIKLIYKSVKDFLEAFTGNKKKFNRPVLANLDGPEIWRLGFITQDDASNFELPGYAVVYIPLSYALTGVTYFVPKEKLKLLNHVSSSEAMKFAVTGGVTEVE
ncbi:MAG: DUF502 domain-containing protein [Sediminibacterium sp.]